MKSWKFVLGEFCFFISFCISFSIILTADSNIFPIIFPLKPPRNGLLKLFNPKVFSLMSLSPSIPKSLPLEIFSLNGTPQFGQKLKPLPDFTPHLLHSFFPNIVRCGEFYLNSFCKLKRYFSDADILE